MKTNMEHEKTRLTAEIRKQCEQERLRAIEETKRKQWCVNCSKEAKFYCCWNTSYCDYPCQQQHWPRHIADCGQNDGNLNSHTNTNQGNEINGSRGITINKAGGNKGLATNKAMVPPRILNNTTHIRPVAALRNPAPIQRLVSIV